MTTTKAPPTCVWTGKSGIEYEFFIYTLPASLNTGQDGNYIYAKKNAAGRWVPVYIGQGDLGERCGVAHHKAACIQKKGATHFHCHLNGDENRRRAEEVDILARYANAYQPQGCNERQGG